MADIQELLKSFNDNRLRVWEEAKRFLDDTERRHPGQPMTGEEAAQWDRYNASLDEYDAQIKRVRDAEMRDRETAVAREAAGLALGSDDGIAKREMSEVQQFRAFLRGDRSVAQRDFEGKLGFAVNVNAAMQEANLIRQGADPKEVRALLWDTGSIASAVPTVVSRSLYQILEASISMFRAPTTKLPTANGDSIVFPTVATHGIATQVKAQGTALAGSDPVFGKMQLDAYKYGQLLQVSYETVQDAVIDVVGFVTGNIGRALGRVIDTDLVAGSGSGKPQGITTAAIVGGASGTISTGGSLINPTYENLVDLVYSVNDMYRHGGNAAWIMHDLTASVIRKLRDGSGGTIGQPLWQPAWIQGITQGEPDRLLGYPVFTDPNVASLASDAKAIVFGDFSAYYIRTVGDVVIERSDDYAFNVDEITYRGKWRVDGDVIDLKALNLLKRSV